MSKPSSMSYKDFLIRTLAVKLAIDEKLVETIVNHQFKSANEAMDIHKSIEVSGFGKFVLNVKKAQRKMNSLIGKRDAFQAIIDDADKKQSEKDRAKVIISKTIEQINLLKPTISHD